MTPLFARRRTSQGEEMPPLRERLQALRLVPRFLLVVWQTSPAYGSAIVAVRGLAAFGPLALLWVGKLIIDAVLANVGAAEPDWRGLIPLVALEMGIALGIEMLNRLSSLLDSLLGDLFGIEMSLRIMRHAAALDLAQFEDPEFNDCLERARRQTAGRAVLMGTLLQLGQELLTVASLLAALFAYNVWLLVILVVAILPSFLGETRYAAIAYSLMFRQTPGRRELEYLRYIAASDATAKEVKLFGLSDHFVKRYSDLADRLYRANREVSIHRAVTGIVLASLSTMAYYGAVAFMVVEAVSGAITIGALTFLMGSFRQSRNLISGILIQSAGVYERSLFLGDLFGFLEVEPRVLPCAKPRRVPRPIRHGFIFEDVGFRYPGRKTWALRHVSFELLAGERLALVGENGAGKTTLVKLLTRLYDPTEGCIRLDGVDLREYDLEELRSEIGVIFQDFVRYDLVARENIAVGQIEALADDGRILEAARSSQAIDVLGRLHRGLDHMLGRRFDGGVNLSGGEWQKIALARAYIRDAQVLILDEPTASLDARAEYEAFRRFSDITSGRMAVLISHRFSTIRMADRILVLDGGRITESGSHARLTQLGGRYAELFSLQAAGYR